MSNVAVLVVDDSAVVRRLLTDILSQEAGLEVSTVGSAALALARISQSKPDVVTLDVEMPGTNGLELLDKIRALHPSLPIIMFSALTLRAGAITLEALAKGASDYVTKPSGMVDRQAAIEHVRRELVPKLRTLGARGERPTYDAGPVRQAPRRPSEEVQAPDVVAIGCSTGGPNALAAIIGELPADFSLPILIVQHMPPIFTRLLAERLTATSRLRVREAEEGDVLQPGQGLVAPGGFHMRVVRGADARPVIALDQTPAVNSCRPAVDRMFESVAATYGARCLALVLTGMGQDGLRGCEAIRARGGQVIAQDEATSVVWGMPGFVARANLAHSVLPLATIASDLLQRVRRPATASGMRSVQRDWSPNVH